jgi:hypothetical protein
MKLRFLLGLCFVLPVASTAFACSGNEYWQDDPKGTPVWISRVEIELDRGESRINDQLLRSALVRAGLRYCTGIERDLVDADVKRAIRTAATAISKQRRWTNYQEVTQVMIRYRVGAQTGAVLEVMTRTKVSMDRSGRFVAAPATYQVDATALANRVAENLNAALGR